MTNYILKVMVDGVPITNVGLPNKPSNIVLELWTGEPAPPQALLGTRTITVP